MACTGRAAAGAIDRALAHMALLGDGGIGRGTHVQGPWRGTMLRVA